MAKWLEPWIGQWLSILSFWIMEGCTYLKSLPSLFLCPSLSLPSLIWGWKLARFGRATERLMAFSMGAITMHYSVGSRRAANDFRVAQAYTQSVLHSQPLLLSATGLLWPVPGMCLVIEDPKLAPGPNGSGGLLMYSQTRKLWWMITAGLHVFRLFTQNQMTNSNAFSSKETVRFSFIIPLTLHVCYKCVCNYTIDLQDQKIGWRLALSLAVLGLFLSQAKLSLWWMDWWIPWKDPFFDRLMS